MRNHHEDGSDAPDGSNPTRSTHFRELAERAFTRRQVLQAGVAFSAWKFLSWPHTAAASGPPSRASIGFSTIAAHSDDVVTVPPGYRAQVFMPWGEPIHAGGPKFKPDASNSAADQAQQMGDNHDGMHFFPIDQSASEGLLVVNHEYVNNQYLFPAEAGQKDVYGNWTAEKVLKSQHAHGVSVVHVVRDKNGEWRLRADSRYNRRIHANTPTQLKGPAAGHPLLRTTDDPQGTTVLGTFNNCGNGFTPWGTYLTCEENFNANFGCPDPDIKPTALMQRYGIDSRRSPFFWEAHDPRFDWGKHPNESNRHGWVVEIDPFDPASVPVKHTALGRFKHETAMHSISADGRIVIYMGDDEQNEYIYKFVSAGRFDAAKKSANSRLLDEGDLYVARFLDGDVKGDSRGVGEWLLLDKQRNPRLATHVDFPDQATVLINTRHAASVLGATPMDRPEWLAVDPLTKTVYATLTNNSLRTVADDANPRAPNIYGHIIRWTESGGDPAALIFAWDHFVIAGNPTAQPLVSAGSPNVTAANHFNSPDGLQFDAAGRLWICTDGSYSNQGTYAGQGNNQLLLGDPVSGEIRRFMVGPSGCELTGAHLTPDLRTLFVNVQHPGDPGDHPRAAQIPGGQSRRVFMANNPLAFSQWPDAKGGRPRSATVIVEKIDGGIIGS